MIDMTPLAHGDRSSASRLGLCHDLLRDRAYPEARCAACSSSSAPPRASIQSYARQCARVGPVYGGQFTGTVQRVLSAIYFRTHRSPTRSRLGFSEQHASSAVRRRGRTSSRGTIRPSGNKNAALPIVAAALLTEQSGAPRERPAHPRRRDARRARSLRRRQRRMDRAQHARTSTRRPSRPPSSIRRSAPRFARRFCSRRRCSRAAARSSCPPPGGDVIGRRRLDTHFLALEQLGAPFELEDSCSTCAPTGSRGADVFLDEPSVTATENALVGRVGRDGHDDASQRRQRAARAGPLRTFSSRMGAEIEGIGTNTMTIDGGTTARRRDAHASAPITSRSARSSGSPR